MCRCGTKREKKGKRVEKMISGNETRTHRGTSPLLRTLRWHNSSSFPPRPCPHLEAETSCRSASKLGDFDVTSQKDSRRSRSRSMQYLPATFVWLLICSGFMAGKASATLNSTSWTVVNPRVLPATGGGEYASST